MLLVKPAGPQKISEAIAVLGSALYQHYESCWAFRKSLASDGVGRATTVWISSFNANTRVFVFFFFGCCSIFPASCHMYRWAKASIQGTTLNSNRGLWFMIRPIHVHRTGIAPCMCILIQQEVIWWISLPRERGLLDLLPYFTFPTDNHHPQSRTW